MIFVSLLLSACGGGDSFRVIGTVDGLGTQNIRVVYYSDQAVRSTTTTAIDGKFNFEGRSAQPVIIELYTNTRTPIGRLVVQNGETVESSFSLEDPSVAQISGNKVSQGLVSFIKDNKDAISSGDRRSVNDAVARYVAAHREDFLSTVLMLTYYDAYGNERMADSLMSLIDVKMRPSSLVEGYMAMLEHERASVTDQPVLPMTFYSLADTMATVNPARSAMTLLGFTMASVERRDSVVPLFNRLLKDKTGHELQIVEISFDTDTAAWKAEAAAVEPDYLYVWAPGAVSSAAVEKLSVPRVPYFIVADSTGRQLYRGSSVAEVSGLLK